MNNKLTSSLFVSALSLTALACVGLTVTKQSKPVESEAKTAITYNAVTNEDELYNSSSIVLAVKEYGKLLRSHQEELLKAMDTITDAYITYGEDLTDDNGRFAASAEDKQNVVARMQSQFLNSKTAEIGEKVKNHKLNADEAAEELEKLDDI